MFSIFKPLAGGYSGLALAVTIALCAGFLSEHYGAPVMLFALLVGMAFNFLADHPKCAGGITFASKSLLRMGVALLGFRLSLGDVTAQGWEPVAVIIALVVLTIASGALLAPLFKRKIAFGILTGGATAICGASAALAISAVMPKRDNLERDTLFTVVAVTTLSTVAMVLYPLLFSVLGFNDEQAGFLIGATIHDVAQVVGAGFSISDEAGNVATLTKLQRVLLLPLVILAILLATQKSDGERVGIPLFVIAFIVFMLINSTGVLPEAIVASFVEASRWMLITAIAALGVKTSLGAMVNLGGNHIALVVAQTVFLLGAAIAAKLLFL
ncbi:MAG: putative sulfate exporter family transporter [Rhizobiales bacterium]|nr:putative sulfate exporter family transporter [Hyphomicrobiales bacterium]MBO6697547.1 putative sulfate exporter family transporter [Hyphomicrobiales bacterium]MBO6736198.1 putative sulfate exporter family transporter [Hyphomicrobiales bacterium]MBO6912668.1 putative sulfate exporter family transporter [Hyphomicrobiales bacterium]MBO6956401.1 putative sulfate exporter family transporter [Hyphomicrobiales bacterium]